MGSLTLLISRQAQLPAGVTDTIPQFTEFTPVAIVPALKELNVALFPGTSGGLLRVKLV
jgi:hypothetical protein